MSHAQLRRVLTIVWLACAAAALYVYFWHREALEDLLNGATHASVIAGGGMYLLLGCLRGFTLIPVTSFVLLGVVIFPPWPLLALTLAGIIVSSASVFSFAEALHIEELLAPRRREQLGRLKSLLERRGLPIIIGWSFLPFVPTDLIVYLAGILRLSLARVLLGVAIGEGAICAIYIFLGDWLLRGMGMR